MFGIGLRACHFDAFRKERPLVDWVEAISEDYLDKNTIAFERLLEIRARYPVALHGVSLSIGGTDLLDESYLVQMGQLIEAIDPFIVSDHLCWTGVGGVHLQDLLPLPQQDAVVHHVVARLQQVKSVWKRRLLLENVSSYLSYTESVYPEWEFLTRVVTAADVDILLDVNNVCVNAYNQGFDPVAYVNALPVSRVKQFHLGGHQVYDTHRIDTHDCAVSEEVWALYHTAVRRFGLQPTLLEWDTHIPPLSVMLAEVERARAEIGRAHV